ncbi:MAG: MarC family protein [Methanosarcinales archaeon]|nr:MarC family protein [ANME-2 cluster archaeon]MDW7775838.1 MarC family protein [Methanosarcinales archaeon]
MDAIAFFIFSFASIFVIVNPVSGVLTFISLTAQMDFEDKNAMAKRSVVLACIIALFFAITGDLLLKVFGINVDLLRVAGGILLFTIAFDMMHARISQESVTTKEIQESQNRDDVWIFPIAMPILTGPGTITTIIVLIGSNDVLEHKLIVILAILLNFLLSLIVFMFSRRINKWIGYTGMLVFTRIMGLFLAALAVGFVTTGIWNIYQTFL